jgi:hypothetical protein
MTEKGLHTAEIRTFIIRTQKRTEDVLNHLEKEESYEILKAEIIR